MKSSKLILALWLGASAWALTSPQQQAAKPQLQPSVSATAPHSASQSGSASRGAGTSAPSAAQQNTKVPGRRPSASRIASSPRSAAPRSSARPAAPDRPAAQASGKSQARSQRAARARSTQTAAGGAAPRSPHSPRDPFVSPVVQRTRSAAACTGTGRQCLLVSEIGLQGVVSSSSGNIAVVVNGTHTYFLRNHDPLADGVVERISKDAIILRERSSDATGHPQMREVTKKLGAPAD